jgi:tetratricopeptide (TPR) repeat protein
MVLYALDDEAGAARTSSRLIAHARTLGGGYGLVHAQLWRSLHLYLVGEFAAAVTAAEEAINLCDEFEFPPYRPTAAFHRALALARLGPPQAALEQAQQALADLDRLEQRHPRASYLSALAGLHVLARDFASALETIDIAIDMAERLNEGYFLSPSHHLKAGILSRLPNADMVAVKASLDAALAVARAQGAARFIREAEAALDRFAAV